MNLFHLCLVISELLLVGLLLFLAEFKGHSLCFDEGSFEKNESPAQLLLQFPDFDEQSELVPIEPRLYLIGPWVQFFDPASASERQESHDFSLEAPFDIVHAQVPLRKFVIEIFATERCGMLFDLGDRVFDVSLTFPDSLDLGLQASLLLDLFDACDSLLLGFVVAVIEVCLNSEAVSRPVHILLHFPEHQF